MELQVVSLGTFPKSRSASERVYGLGRCSKETNERTAATVFANYSVSRDGTRFFMIETGEESPSDSRLHVILNWSEELKRLVPTD